MPRAAQTAGGLIKFASRLYLGCIVSRLYLDCISAVFRLYLGCISAPHPQAAQTTGAVGAAENSRCAKRSLYLGYISAHAPKFVRHEIVGA